MQVSLKIKQQKKVGVKNLKRSNRLNIFVKRHWLRTVSLLVLIALAIFLVRARPVKAPSNGKIAGGSSPVMNMSWLKIPGAQLERDGLRINPLGRVIVEQDGSGSQANPPVNAAGSHFDVSGDFEIYASFINASEGGASLQYYSSPPIIYDEWRFETPSVRFYINDNGVTASIWDGTSSEPVQTHLFAVGGSISHLFMESSGGKLTLYADSRKIGSMDDHKIFSSGHVWVGADAKSPGPGWTINDLHASGLGKGTASLVAAPTLSVSHVDPNALRNLAQKASRPLKIGAAITLNPLMSDDSYRQLAGGQFSMLTPENEMKAQFIHPQPEVYVFDDADAIVAFAEANGMTVHGHALVFGEANPKWMQATPPSQLQQVMVDHIQQVVGHFKGKVAEWDVVNEPLSDDDSNSGSSVDMRDTIWQRAMGEAFIDKAFEAAHKADPSAKLYLNEYGLEADGERWDSLIALVGRLQARHIPIDGIGFQSHVYEAADHEDPAVLKSHIQQLAKLGLLSRISEIDVHGEDAVAQAKEYAGVLGACLSEPTCTSFSTWGITNLYGSTTDIGSYPLDFGDDLLWDKNFQPKPAYGSLQQALKGR